MFASLGGAVGIIQSVDPENYTAKVKLFEYDDMITGDLQILSPLSYLNQEIHLPEVNTPVVCIFFNDDTENGFVIGCFFSDKNKSKSKKGEYKINFRKSTLTISDDGNIKLDAELTTINSEVEITKGLKVVGALEVDKTIDSKEDITTQGKSYAKGFVPI